jgi:hypothetical protein
MGVTRGGVSSKVSGTLKKLAAALLRGEAMPHALLAPARCPRERPAGLWMAVGSIAMGFARAIVWRSLFALFLLGSWTIAQRASLRD